MPGIESKVEMADERRHYVGRKRSGIWQFYHQVITGQQFVLDAQRRTNGTVELAKYASMTTLPRPSSLHNCLAAYLMKCDSRLACT